MEVLNPNLTSITAFETLELVRDLKREQARIIEEEIQRSIRSSDPRSVEQETNALIQHLNPTNLDQVSNNILIQFDSNTHDHLPQSKQSVRSILSLSSTLRSKFGQISGHPHGLTKAERLQICDLAPTELVEIYLIIEECDSRFKEDEIEEILSLVKQNLTEPQPRTMSSNEQGPRSSTRINHDHQSRGTLDDLDDGLHDEINLGDIDDDDALVDEAREGAPPIDQELDEVPD